jgi:ribose transport system permease protein
MTVSAAAPASRSREAGHEAPLIFGGWEIGLLVVMALLYLGGLYLNPAFFGATDALFSVLRDASRYGVMAVGMTFVLVNRELDLSVGSTFGLTATFFGMLFAPSYFDFDLSTAVIWCLVLGLVIGLINGFLVTILEVPAFIATLTMLFIGRGVILGLTGGKNIAFEIKAQDKFNGWFFQLGELNSFGFNNQIIVFLIIAALGAVALAYTSIGWTTYATGGNEQAARYAGINTRFVRIRSYVLSSLCAVIAGLMNVAQSKDADPAFGLGAELIAIASVIVGGAAIFGGRGRVIGSCLGAIFVGLIDKVLREGVPITRTIDLGGGDTATVAAVAQLPPGAVPAFLGIVLVLAVLIEPLLVRRRVFPRLWARLRRRPPPPIPDLGGIAITGVQTRGVNVQARGLGKRGIVAFFYRRDAAAVILMIVLWLFGWWARPDFWQGLDNSFSILLAFSEIALLAVGLSFVMANGDIDLSVGSVLALSGATAAVVMKDTDLGPLVAAIAAIGVGMLAGVINGWLTAYVGLPAFIATLGTFYWARGIGSSIVAGTQLNGFPESFNLIGHSLYELLDALGMTPTGGLWLAVTKAVSVQTIFVLLVALIGGIVLAHTTYGEKVYAVGGNERAASFAGINTRRVRFTSLLISATCAAFAGVIYDAFYRSFIPTAGQLRELDAISSIIIGGGSIFGGYGTMIGAMAGAAVLTLIRQLMSLQIILRDGSSFVLPQQWQNVFIGLILIIAVIGDIWIRQNNILGQWFGRARPGEDAASAAKKSAPTKEAEA